MHLTLERTQAREDGIFGKLLQEDGTLICYTLEHAYDSGHGDGSYVPKVKPGDYTCVKGPHRLHMHTPIFTTFEVKGVKGHTGILFHPGNTNADSNGCILTGTHIVAIDSSGDLMLSKSRVAFQKLMQILEHVNTFTLTVK